MWPITVCGRVKSGTDRFTGTMDMEALGMLASARVKSEASMQVAKTAQGVAKQQGEAAIELLRQAAAVGQAARATAKDGRVDGYA